MDLEENPKKPIEGVLVSSVGHCVPRRRDSDSEGDRGCSCCNMLNFLVTNGLVFFVFVFFLRKKPE